MSNVAAVGISSGWLSGPAFATSLARSIFEFDHFYSFDGNRRNLPADQLGDGSNGVAVFRSRQHKGPALAAGSSRAADAMHIILGVGRHIKAEDVAQSLNIEPAGSDVAGDEKPDLPVAKTIQRLGALRLRHVAVQGCGVEPVTGQRAEEAVDMALAGAG